MYSLTPQACLLIILFILPTISITFSISSPPLIYSSTQMDPLSLLDLVKSPHFLLPSPHCQFISHSYPSSCCCCCSNLPSLNHISSLVHFLSPIHSAGLSAWVCSCLCVVCWCRTAEASPCSISETERERERSNVLQGGGERERIVYVKNEAFKKQFLNKQLNLYTYIFLLSVSAQFIELQLIPSSSDDLLLLFRDKVHTKSQDLYIKVSIWLLISDLSTTQLKVKNILFLSLIETGAVSVYDNQDQLGQPTDTLGSLFTQQGTQT